MALSLLREYGHEQVTFVNNEEADLKAIIAIHDTTLGPALGGCRMYPYASEADALKDVLRLSRGMTYKAAAAGLNLGGGKAVILGDPKKVRKEALFRAFGRAVEALGGRYITAEDMGTGVEDMEYIFMETRWVTGLDIAHGGSGDPSPFTALGVVQGMRACLKLKHGDETLRGRRVALQGLGHVGLNVLKQLAEEKAEVVATDVDEQKIAVAREVVPSLKIVGADEIYEQDADIFAPCAMGAVINTETIDRLGAPIIAGAANNQLENDGIGEELMRRGVIYAPDYVINAGGLINVSEELEGYSRERALRLTRNIYFSTLDIFEVAKAEGIPSNKAADRLAEKRIETIRKVRGAFVTFHRQGTTRASQRPFSRA